MKCGNACEKTCHVYDCNEQKCLKPCRKINPNCKLFMHECIIYDFSEENGNINELNKEIDDDLLDEYIKENIYNGKIRILRRYYGIIAKKH